MEHRMRNKREKTKIKKVNELNDHEVETLYNTLKNCDEISEELDPNIEKLKEEINNKIFSLRLDVETDRNNLEFFERNISIKSEEIDRLMRKLTHLLSFD